MDPHHDPFDGDEEAALRYAIALSLQDPNASMYRPASQVPIEIDSDENEDDDLENQPGGPTTPKKPTRSGDDDNAQAVSTTSHSLPLPQSTSLEAQSSGFTALGLDRKKMEEERLARAAKRKAPHDDEKTGHRPQRTKLSNQSPATTTPHIPSVASLTLPYPKGIVKKTVSASISYQSLLCH